MSVPVGKDVESMCGKCGDVWHVVVAKVGEQIVKVQCKECGAYHRHRVPERLRVKTPSARTRVEGSSSSSRSSSPRAPKPPPGPSVQADPTRPMRVYKPHFTFAVGDTIDHVTFGRGVVEALPERDRIQVWFSGERKVLIHGRTTQATPPKE